MSRKSLLNRVAGRIGRVKDKVKDGVRAVQEEASHPGEPVPHRRGQSPFHQTAEDREAAAAAEPRAYQPGGDTSVDPFTRKADDEAGTDGAWYLQGEHEGWDETNPGDEPPDDQ